MLRASKYVLAGILVAVAVGAFATIGGGLPVHNHGSSSQGGTTLLPVPVGTILDYAGTTLPTNFKETDGTAYSRTTCSGLFAAISTTWGVGDGSTTFNVPDLRRRVTVGHGGATAGGLANSIGSTGGAETITLTTNELPSHSHSYDDYYQTTGVAATLSQVQDSGGASAPITAINEAGATTARGTAAAGSGAAFNQRPPSAVVRKIIKADC